MKGDFEKTRVAGVELFVRKGAVDRRLIMLHGIGSNHTSFDGLCERLPDDVELIIWDAPGYGESVPLTPEHPVATDYANKLHSVVNTLDLDHFNLLGHSLGTLIAAEYARHHGEKVDALILLSCAQGYGMDKDSSLPAKAQQRLIDLDAEGSVAFAQKRAPRLLHQPDRKPDLAKAAVVAMSQINPAGYKQAVYMLAAGNLEQSARQVHCNSLTIAASEDVITPTEQSKRCHGALCSANPDVKHTYVEVAGAGHVVHQEEPTAVAAHIVEFCRWDADNVTEQSA